MKRIYILIIALLLLPNTSALLSAQVRVMSPITTKIARRIKKQEPGWDYTPGVCTCPPLVAGQLSHDVGTWERELKGGKREVLYMDIYKIATAEEAADWIGKFGRGEMGMVCQISKYELSDEAYILECPDDPRNTINLRNSIYYRKDNFIVEVRGQSQKTVERFARYALLRLSAI